MEDEIGYWLLKHIALTTLLETFENRCIEITKTIIDELSLSNEKQTYKSDINSGGLLGGIKYTIDGIFIKLAITNNNNGFWTNDNSSMKNAANELRALKEYITCSCDIKDCCFELVVMLDYKGFRVLCFSELPIVPLKTIIYGSPDAGLSFHYSEDAKMLMQSISKKLNLREHIYNNKNKELFEIYSPGDTEVHKGTDGRYYIIDLSRTFPPELLSNSHSHFNQFRPEFILNYEQPLNPDSFTAWNTFTDPNHIQYHRDILHATNYYLSVLLINTSIEFNRCNDLNKINYLEKELIRVIHRKGINVRHIGLLRHLIKDNIQLKTILLTEMIVRVLKTQLKQIMRNQTKQNKDSNLQNFLINFIVDNYQSDEFWKITIKQLISLKFDYWKQNCINPIDNSQQNLWLLCIPNITQYSSLTIIEQSHTFDLRSNLDTLSISQKVLRSVGIKLTSSSKDLFNYNIPFEYFNNSNNDIGNRIVGFEVRTKHSQFVMQQRKTPQELYNYLLFDSKNTLSIDFLNKLMRAFLFDLKSKEEYNNWCCLCLIHLLQCYYNRNDIVQFEISMKIATNTIKEISINEPMNAIKEEYDYISSLQFLKSLYSQLEQKNFKMEKANTTSRSKRDNLKSSKVKIQVEKQMYIDDFTYDDVKLMAENYEFTKEELHEKVKNYLQKDKEIEKYYEIKDKEVIFYTIKEGNRIIECTIPYKQKEKEKKYLINKLENREYLVNKPLNEIKIALDPGDIGGEFSKIESRYIQIETNNNEREELIAFDTGTLTLATAKVLKNKLENLGAKVIVTRQSVGQLVSVKSFDDWLIEHFTPQLKFKHFIQQFSDSTFTNESYLFTKAMLQSPKSWLKTVFFRAYLNIQELQARCKIINDFEPEITIRIGYDVATRPNEETGKHKVTNNNTCIAFIPGSFMNSELSMLPYRIHYARLLLTHNTQHSQYLSTLIIQELAKSIGVTPCPNTLPHCMLSIKDSPGVYCRNLSMTKFVRSPICYVNALCQDNADECLKLSKKDFEIEGILTSSRVIDVANSLCNGILRYFTESQPSSPFPRVRFVINTKSQSIRVIDNNNTIIWETQVSTSKCGVGYKDGSFQTPDGNFRIAQMIGNNESIYTVFKGRKKVGIWNPLNLQTSDEDLILTRILWLSGLDFNNFNTFRRLIYIHGTNREDLIGTAASLGCIRMRNEDIIKLFQ